MGKRDDLIRRGDALEICKGYGASGEVIGDEIRAIPAASLDPVAVNMETRRAIHDALRHYRQIKVMDEYGHGYPLVDALTLESHGIDMGEREIEHIADCIIAAITSRPEAEIRAEALREAPEVTALVEALRKIRQATLPIYDDAALDATTVRKAAEIARAALAKWEAANG